MNTNTPNDSINSTVRDLYIEIEEWRQETKANNIRFYSDAIAHNELHVVVGKDFTVRKANCDVCLKPQKPGMKKFRYIPRRGLAFWFHPCDACWNEIVAAADLPTLVLAQVNTNALA